MKWNVITISVQYFWAFPEKSFSYECEVSVTADVWCLFCFSTFYSNCLAKLEELKRWKIVKSSKVNLT